MPEIAERLKPAWRRRLRRLPVLAVAAYGAFVLLGFVGQRHMLFPGRHMPTLGSGEPFHEGTRVVWLESGGDRVEGWYVPPPDDVARPAPAVLFTHGNGELIDYWEDEAWKLRGLGMAVLLVEYPGYGRSGGRPTEEGVTRAAVAAFDFLAGLEEVDPQRIVAVGRSVGGGAAGALTRERPVAALVLQSTFTDVPAMAGRFLFPPFLVRDRFDTRSAVERYGGPVLVFHGRRDDLIPVEHGEALADAAGERGRFVPMECAYDDCPPDAAAFRAELRRFLEEHGILTGDGPEGPP